MTPAREDVAAAASTPTAESRTSGGPADRVRELIDRAGGRLPMWITHKVPVRHPEPPAVVRRRRRVVTAVAATGATLLGVSLSTRPGSKEFYGLTLAVAGIWTVGGFQSGPLHLGWIQARDQRLTRPIITPLATGVGAFGLFYGAALVARRIPVLAEAITRVLQFAEQGSGPLVVATTWANGVGEEIFFRGALYAALPEHPVITSTAVYTVATATTRNPSLVLAAGVMGTLFGLQRRASNGIQAPILTHLAWSSLMLRYLPPLFRDQVEELAPEERRGVA